MNPLKNKIFITGCPKCDPNPCTGQILGRIGKNEYLASDLNGKRFIVKVKEMEGWLFFDTFEDLDIFAENQAEYNPDEDEIEDTMSHFEGLNGNN